MPTKRSIGSTRYLLTVYGFQATPNALRKAHTFAEVTKTTFLDDGSSTDTKNIISWLPKSGVIHLTRPEPGRNYKLAETLDWAARARARICSTQPTEVTKEFYESFLERMRELDSGTVLYIMKDKMSSRPHRETNCIHAISDLPIALDAQGMLTTKAKHGWRASEAVYKYFRRWFVRGSVLGGHTCVPWTREATHD